MYFIYTFALSGGLLLAFPYYLVRFRKYLPTFRDRLGFLRLPQLQRSIWVHAVSVGEVKAVEKLLEGLRREFLDKPLVVSTATPAGQDLARQRRDIIDHTFYFPLDLPWCVARSLNRVNPDMVLIAETEIWPNFLRECRRRGIRVSMINGRISDRSFARYRVVRRWLRRVFQDYTIMGMQSETDRQRIEAIGADPQRVTVFGNLKYDVASSAKPLDAALAAFLGNWLQIWVAASTMPGEEEFVLDSFSELRQKHSGLRLVIAPRHADRFATVEELVKRRGFSCVRRTECNLGTDCGNLGTNYTVLLLDTIGELAAVLEYATVVFMGGSLVSKGGHNILEPARQRKPIVFGPHMENFRDITRLFLDAGAALQIHDPSQLGPAIEKLLSNPGRASELGRNAYSVAMSNTGATDRVLKFFQPVEAGR
jgi:3-deoxy-D-manno-octulosonic-acid transferase